MRPADDGTFQCQWPEDSIDEYVNVIRAIRHIAAERSISPHEAFLLVMHAKFPQLPEPKFVQEHARRTALTGSPGGAAPVASSSRTSARRSGS